MCVCVFLCLECVSVLCVFDTTHLKDQHSRVCDSQVDPHSLTVVRRVRPDAVHIQLPGHLQQLNVRLSR